MIGSLQDHGQDMDVARRIDKSACPTQCPMDDQVDGGLVVEWFVPGGGKMRSIAPGAALGGLDQLYSRVFARATAYKASKLAA